MKNFLFALALSTSLVPNSLFAKEITVKFKVADFYSQKPITDWARGWGAMDISASSLLDGKVKVKVVPALDERGNPTETLVFPAPGRYQFEGPGSICSLAQDTIEITQNIVEIVLFAGCE